MVAEILLNWLLTCVHGIRWVIFSLFVESVESRVKQTFVKFGIKINGSEAWDIQVRDANFFKNVALNASLGLGEGYMDKLWDVQDLNLLFRRMFSFKLEKKKTDQEKNWQYVRNFLNLLRFKLSNQQSRSRSRHVVDQHYDLGNSFFETLLDPNMSYTCGYWKFATNLEDAQIAKMDLIAQKLHLRPGMQVLDIGCGWGGLAKYLAKEHHVSVVGLTISEEQAKYARDFCSGYDVDIQLMDYRDLPQYSKLFDRIVVVGMIEHVGAKNYNTFFDICSQRLKRDGLFLLHCIGLNTKLVFRSDPFAEKYIFPNGELPLHTDIARASTERFVIEDWHNFGFDYADTLKAWTENFCRHRSLHEEQYGERFCRMFQYWLISCEEAFRARKYQLWQIVFSKNGFPGGYISVR